MAYPYLVKQNPGIITHQIQNMATGSLASTSHYSSTYSGLHIIPPDTDTIPMTVTTANDQPEMSAVKPAVAHKG